jgi:multiple sugar transport system substrate-binding protein
MQPRQQNINAKGAFPQDRARNIGRRNFLAGGLTAAAFAAAGGPLLEACGSSSPSPATSKADDVLTIGLPVSPQNFNATTKLMSAFTKQTGITINPFTTNTTTNTWVAVFQEISTRLAGGEPIDSAYIATEGMLLFEKQNLLEPLDSYIASDQPAMNSFYSDVSPQLLQHFRALDDLNGHTYFIGCSSFEVSRPVRRRVCIVPG